MKVKAATFTTSGRLMRNKESTLPGLMYLHSPLVLARVAPGFDTGNDKNPETFLKIEPIFI